MCGFIGEYNKRLISESEFSELLMLSRHRGPDDSKIWRSELAQFGFNRLSILDLSESGAQPMKSPSGRYVVMLNGEIYNHLDIRNSLPDHGYRGNGDTETLCYAIDELGIEKAISKLDGMFAIAVFDMLARSLSLARDFAGIKPLFYGQIGAQVVFASQYDQLTGHPLFESCKVREDVLKLYLSYHYMPAPHGLIENTHQVLPGELIHFDQDGSRRSVRYWELPREKEISIKDHKEALEFINNELEYAVHSQMLSDVPLGAFLSGGVDSPLVCAQAVKKDKDLKVFSIGSDSKVHDESQLASKFAKDLNLDQKIWELNSSEMLSYWQEAMESIHEPIADYSILPTYLVSKLAKENVTVSLSGDGGDELFYGYPRFWTLGKNSSLRSLPKSIRKGLYAADKLLTKNRNVNDTILDGDLGYNHKVLHSRFRAYELDVLFPHLKDVEMPLDWDVYAYGNPGTEEELMSNMRYAEFYGMMQKTLRKVDLASMQNSLEVRVPFLSKRFIEASLKVDYRLSYGKGMKKMLLKDLLAQYFNWYEDDKVKRGFNVPLGKWIREDLKTQFQGGILEGNLVDLGLNVQEAEKMLNGHIDGSRDKKWPLFTLLALDQYVVNQKVKV